MFAGAASKLDGFTNLQPHDSTTDAHVHFTQEQILTDMMYAAIALLPLRIKTPKTRNSSMHNVVKVYVQL